MSEISSFSPEERIQQVIARSENNTTAASQAKTQAEQTAGQANASSQIFETKAAGNAAKLSELTAEKAQVRGLNAIADFVTGKAGNRDNEIHSQQQQQEQNIQISNAKKEESDAAAIAAQNADKTARHEATVAEANRRNIDPDHYATPITTSKEQTSALAKQAELSKELKAKALEEAETKAFYTEIGYKAEMKYLLPPEMVKEIKGLVEPSLSRRSGISRESYYARIGIIDVRVVELTKIVEEFEKTNNYEDWQRVENIRAEVVTLKKSKEEDLQQLADFEKKLNAKVGEVTASFEATVKIAEQLGVEVNLHLFVIAFKEGLQIFENGQTEGRRIFKEHFGRDASSSEIGYQTIGAGMLEKFFKLRPNIKDRARVPYIMAYAAGAAEFNRGDFLRFWIASAIDLPRPERVIKDGKMETTTVNRPLGFDYFLSADTYRNAYFGGFVYPGLAEGMRLGNEAAILLMESLEDHRFQNAANRLKPSGMEYLHSSDIAKELAKRLPRSS